MKAASRYSEKMSPLKNIMNILYYEKILVTIMKRHDIDIKLANNRSQPVRRIILLK